MTEYIEGYSEDIYSYESLLNDQKIEQRRLSGLLRSAVDGRSNETNPLSRIVSALKIPVYRIKLARVAEHVEYYTDKLANSTDTK